MPFGSDPDTAEVYQSFLVVLLSISNIARKDFKLSNSRLDLVLEFPNLKLSMIEVSKLSMLDHFHACKVF
jgi:DNA-binding sugar fermentation-stimulating protein